MDRQHETLLINTEQAAQLLGLGVTTVRRLANQGQIPTVAVRGGPKYYLYSSEELRAWVDAHCPLEIEEWRSTRSLRRSG